MDEKILNLPWEIQLALGSGYAAYMLAYLGIREHHKAIDVTFRAIAFGLCTTAVLTLIPPQYGWKRIALAIAAAILSGVLWRYWLGDGVQWLVRKLNLSWADETPSAWSRITQHNRQFYYSQITVLLDDDSCVSCNDTRPFDAAPFGPCTLGPTGDVAMYVTHKAGATGGFEEVSRVRDEHQGDELTYIPASRIRKVKVRLMRRVNGSVAEEVGR